MCNTESVVKYGIEVQKVSDNTCINEMGLVKLWTCKQSLEKHTVWVSFSRAQSYDNQVCCSDKPSLAHTNTHKHNTKQSQKRQYSHFIVACCESYVDYKQYKTIPEMSISTASNRLPRESMFY